MKNYLLAVVFLLVWNSFVFARAIVDVLYKCAQAESLHQYFREK